MTVASTIPHPPWLDEESILGVKKTRRSGLAGKGQKQRSNGGPTGSSLSPLYKTRLCNFYAIGACKAGPLCGYAHGEAELRQSPDFSKTSVCPIMLKLGKCNKQNCRYAHESDELQVSPVMLKTKMCSYFLAGGCVVGEACRFAHSPGELREASEVQHGRRSCVEQRRFDFLAKRDSASSAQPTGEQPSSELDFVATTTSDGAPDGNMLSRRARRQLVRSQWVSNAVLPSSPPASSSADPLVGQVADWLVAQARAHASQQTVGSFAAELVNASQNAAQSSNQVWLNMPQQNAHPPPGLFQLQEASMARATVLEQPFESEVASPTIASSAHPSAEQRLESEVASPTRASSASRRQRKSASSARKVTVTDQTETVEIIEVHDDIEAEGSAAVVEPAGRVVVASTALAAEDVLEGFLVDCEDIAWRNEAAVRTLAGIGAAVVLQRRVTGATTETNDVLDIEDLNTIGNFCGSCELGEDNTAAVEVLRAEGRRRPKSVIADTERAGDETNSHPSALRGRSCGRRAWQQEQVFKASAFADSGGCALCDKLRPRTGEPCAACSCGLRIVTKNTFVELQADDDGEVQRGARRRSKSVDAFH